MRMRKAYFLHLRQSGKNDESEYDYNVSAVNDGVFNFIASYQLAIANQRCKNNAFLSTGNASGMQYGCVYNDLYKSELFILFVTQQLYYTTFILDCQVLLLICAQFILLYDEDCVICGYKEK